MKKKTTVVEAREKLKKELAELAANSADSAKSISSAAVASMNTCPGCHGERLQVRNDGVSIICPVCGGSGMWVWSPTVYPDLPLYPTYPNPHYPGSGGTVAPYPFPLSVID